MGLFENIPLNEIKPSDSNPRTRFDDRGLDELANSIKINGVLQPIIVRKAKTGYELIAGERRFRASLSAGLVTIPAKILEATDEQVLLIQIVENLQRKGINPMEEARAVGKLFHDYSLTIEEIARKIGKAQSHVSYQLSLLKSASDVQESLEQNRISRIVAIEIARMVDHGDQTKAVAALQREHGNLVPHKEAKLYLSHTFGARPNKREESRTVPVKHSEYFTNWKKYLFQFSAEQFEICKRILRGKTDTQKIAEAVETVMTRYGSGGE